MTIKEANRLIVMKQIDKGTLTLRIFHSNYT